MLAFLPFRRSERLPPSRQQLRCGAARRRRITGAPCAGRAPTWVPAVAGRLGPSPTVPSPPRQLRWYETTRIHRDGGVQDEKGSSHPYGGRESRGGGGGDGGGGGLGSRGTI